jgi:hypothetical protein
MASVPIKAPTSYNAMNKTASCLSALLLPFAMQVAFAGTTPPPMTPPPEEPFVTGNLTLAYNTHFISYGQDIWQAGNDWDDALFNPSMELDFNLGKGWQAYLNLWFDVNDNSTSNISKYVQEMDVNVGVYYTMDKWKFQLGYGAWNYASQTESIIDGKISYNDGFWNPFLMLHGRVDSDLGPNFDNGLVAQVGIVPGTKLGPVSLTFPVTVSFDTDQYHGGDSGFAYASVGIGASVPLCKHTSLNLGVTFYHTEENVFPTNPDEDFFTGTAGITIAF